MESAKDIDAWINNMGLRTVALLDWKQRALLFAESIERLSSKSASSCFSSLMGRGFRLREPSTMISMLASLYSISTGAWSLEHQTLTREAAAAYGEELTLSFLIQPEIPKYKEDSFRVPEYNKGRVITLGERKSLATSPDRRTIEIVMSDPNPLVVRKLLDNPRITETDAIRISANRSMSPALLAEIATSIRWRFKSNTAFALVMNTHLPASIGIGLLPGLNSKLVKEIAGNDRLKKEVTAAAMLLGSI